MTAGGSAAILAHLGKNRICRTTQALVCARTKLKRHDSSQLLYGTTVTKVTSYVSYELILGGLC